MGKTPLIDPKKIALVIIDMQRDFCKGGPLAVPKADELVHPINRIKSAAQTAGSLVFASRCWHPEESIHFNDFPKHAVQNTRGAEFHPKLDVSGIIISKGMKPNQHGFSVFDGANEQGNPFGEILKWNGIEVLILTGVAWEYCVLETARDAKMRKGYEVFMLSDCVRAYDPQKNLSVIREMMRMNVGIIDMHLAIQMFFPKKRRRHAAAKA